MAYDIDLPGVDQELDPTDPVGSIQTVVLLVLGFGVLIATAMGGSEVADEIFNRVTGALGVETSEGGPQVQF